MIYRVLRWFLFLLPAETAHHLGVWTLRALSAFPRLCRFLRIHLLPSEEDIDLSIRIGRLRFSHPIALAAGFDKDAVAVPALFGLGFSAVEVGTLTPRPQPGNPKPRLFRLQEAGALLNRLGFNNQGAKPAARRLRGLRFRPGPLGVNVGKNKDTPLEGAAADYIRCIEELALDADYVVVNASSPNTPGLRTLLEPAHLEGLLTLVRQALERISPQRPLFLKIAPDVSDEAVDEIVDIAIRTGVSGLIATNTTVQRPFPHPLASEQGGLSGKPVRELANAVIRRAYRRSGGQLPIIGVGGVFTAEDAYEKLRAGASVVQLYTGFVYGGPASVSKMRRGLADLLRRDRFASAQHAVGADVRTLPSNESVSRSF